MLRRGCGGLKHITVKSLWVQEALLIAIERVPRDVMHAHVLASPSSAEELRKHLTELKAYRDGEAEVLVLAYDVVGRIWHPCGKTDGRSGCGVMIKGVDSVGSCATLDQCRESERVPPVAALALKSTSRIG